MSEDRINILLVDDQPAKLLAYEVILAELGENLLKAQSAREALEHLLRHDVAVILIDVCMPELDGFELAEMIREHPRFQKTAIIFVSAVLMTEPDRLRGYEAGAVDYVSVPVVPPVLRAKVRIFAELFRKTRQLEKLNAELEGRVQERTAALEAKGAQLLQSEQRRTLALAAGQMGSWDWSAEAGVGRWDLGQERIFGLEPGTTPSLDLVRDLIHPGDRERVEAVVYGAEAPTFQLELRIVRPSQDVRWCICAGATVRSARGALIAVSGVTLDITDRKNAEEALRRLNDELEERVETRTHEREFALAQLFEAQKLDTIGQLTGGVAHDFNNLLQAVLTSLQVLQKLVPDDPRALRLLDNAVQGAKRGAALTQRLLAFARRQELKPEAVDFAKLFAGIEDLLQRSLGPRIQIVKHFDTALPLIRIDANQLELALLNLAVNARDAMPEGGQLTVTTSTSTLGDRLGTLPDGFASGDHVQIIVSDDGTGMDAGTIAKAVEPFYTTKGVGKGTGLGLSMVQGLAAQSGGALRIASEVGGGTHVILLLPRATSADVPDDPRPARVSVAPPAATHTILLVDDDPLVAMSTTAMLEDLGHVVFEATNGQRALELVAEHPEIELVITDHVMPGMTGMALARRLRALHPALPVILATGYAELVPGEADELQLPRLSKPYGATDLARAISRAAQPRSQPAA